MLALWTRDLVRSTAQDIRKSKRKFRKMAEHHSRLMNQAHDRGDMETAKMHAKYYNGYSKAAENLIGWMSESNLVSK